MPLVIPIPGARSLSGKMLGRFVFCLAVAYVSGILILLSIEDDVVFHPYPPSRRWADPPSDCNVQDVALYTANGTQIHARWYPCRDAKGAVLVCHSRAGNLSLAVPPHTIRSWHEQIGVSVLVFDYPGYGYSQGRPSEAGYYDAAAAAYDWLTEVQRISPERLLILGRSLGTGVAVELASRRPHQALVLISPFTSIPDVVHSYCSALPARTFMHNRFDSLARIRQCSRPLLIIHGTRDRVVPMRLGKRLFAAACAPKRFVRVEGAGHSDIVFADLLPELRCFLDDLAEGPVPGKARTALAGVAWHSNIP